MRRFFRSTPVAGCGRVRTAVSAPLSFRLHYTAHLHTLGRAFFFFLLPVLICIPMFFFLTTLTCRNMGVIARRVTIYVGH